jgi:hypothetical protein
LEAAEVRSPLREAAEVRSPLKAAEVGRDWREHNYRSQTWLKGVDESAGFSETRVAGKKSLFEERTILMRVGLLIWG